MSKTLFLLAGEPSGDSLGASLMTAIKAQTPDVRFDGIGGDLMAEKGLQSILPMKELAVMGIWEIIWQLPRLIKLIDGVVEEIEERKPDAVVTLDFPDFNFQVVKKLKKRGIYKGKIIHYVAPSVWAWRPKRAQSIAQMYDGLMCLFPFEPKYFEAHKLNTVCVGHPLVEHDFDGASGARFREIYKIAPDAPVLGVFLGSRVSELKRMSKTLLNSAKALKENNPKLEVVLPTLPSLEFDVIEATKDCGFELTICPNPEHKWDAFKACNVALAVSGTVGLELAYMGVPHVITYKANLLTWAVIKSMVKVKYAHLANILLDKPIVPEYLQMQSDAIKISKELLTLFKYPEQRHAQIEAFKNLREALGENEGDIKPSDKAARFVMDVVMSGHAVDIDEPQADIGRDDVEAQSFKDNVSVTKTLDTNKDTQA